MVSFKSLRKFWEQERRPELQREHAKYEAMNFQRRML